MREKLYNILKKTYGIILYISFFAGLLPIFPFIVAIIIGGPTGEAISLFLYKQYYPCIIALASVSVLVGWIALYVGKKDGFSLKKKSTEKDDNKSDNVK